MTTTHIRRCHVCNGTTESNEAAIHRCSHCGKHLAPFYYFDESKLDGLPELGPHLSRWKDTLMTPGTYQPIWGLSTYWQENYESHSRGYS